jgi:hypothetical protein
VICPNKICRQEIPEDSIFCDQCGVQLLRCTKCGNTGTGKFCGKCGGGMAIQEAPPVNAPPPPVPATPAPAAPPPVTPAPEAPAATVIVRLPSEAVFLCHPDGWKLEIKDGDILGRTGGPHSARLGLFPVISSNHARVTRQGGGWLITDLKSTNKTYVNGAKLEPDIPVTIKNNDVVVLANVTFTVSES